MQNNQELRKQFFNASREIKALILHKNFGPEIFIICDEHGVSAKKSLDIEDIVIDVLLGQLNPNSLTKTIMQKTSISEDIAQNITENITENIFKEVMDSLKKIYSVNNKKPALTASDKEIDGQETEQPMSSTDTGLNTQEKHLSTTNNNQNKPLVISDFEKKLQKASQEENTEESDKDKQTSDPYREQIN